MSHMPWIRVSTDLPEHPKSEALALIVGDDRAWTHVLELWLWAAKVRPDGNLAGISDEMLARKCGWKKRNGAAFVRALREVGFMDENTLHDWSDFQRKYVERLEKDRERKARERAEKSADTDADTSTDTSTDKTRNPELFPRARDPARAPVVTRRDETRRDEEQEPAPGVPPAALVESAGREPRAQGKFPIPDAEPPKPPPPADPKRAERELERADGERWLAPALALLGLTRADVPKWGATWHVFVQARKRYGIDALLRSLEGLSADAWAKTAGLPALLSETAITKGLALAARKAPSSSGSPDYTKKPDFLG